MTRKKLTVRILKIGFVLVGVLCLLFLIVVTNGQRIFSGNALRSSSEVDSKASSFVSGGERNDALRKESRFFSGGGYEPLIFDVSNCQVGRDAYYFGLGHTEFVIEGIKEGECVFMHGTEVENPNWDGRLTERCSVPKTEKVILRAEDLGINFSPIKSYCSSYKQPFNFKTWLRKYLT